MCTVACVCSHTEYDLLRSILFRMLTVDTKHACNAKMTRSFDHVVYICTGATYLFWLCSGSAIVTNLVLSTLTCSVT